MKPPVWSFLVGVFAALTVIGGLASRAVLKKSGDVTRGWELRSVLILTRDVAEGEALTAEALAEGRLPEQFVSESTVEVADRSIVVGQKPSFPLQKGDVLVWGVFAEPLGSALTLACVNDIRERVDQAGEQASSEAVDLFVKRIGEPATAAPEGVPFIPDGHGGDVVVAVEDIKEGSVLKRKQLTTRPLPPGMGTASMIRAGDIDALPGARTDVLIQKGDPLLWQVLDDSEVPRSATGCVAEAIQARTDARKRVANGAAAAFVAEKGAP